jgi:polar amino acid transport system ATP-binding protein
MNVLEVKNVSKSYNNKKVLDNFSLAVKKGEIISIIGPSGAGKSTLLRCINGLETLEKGKIIINNKVNKKNISKQANLEIGLIFQDYNLFPQYTVLQNITLPLTKILRKSKAEAVSQAKTILAKLSLQDKENSYPYELSGGEKQRVAIARAIATNPKILCLDEPTSALDPKLVKQIYNIIKDLASQGKAILIVTHDIEFAEKISDKIYKLG